MTTYAQDDLLRIRDQHESWLRQRQGYVGSGVGLDGHGRLSLKVYTDRMSPETRQEVLEHLGDVPTAIEETGPVRLQSSK